MRLSLFILGILVTTLGIGTRANSQNYPWCEYIDAPGGGRNCGFVSFEQCMESARGNGNDCRANTMYSPPPGPHHQTGYTPAPTPYSHRARQKAHTNS